MSDSRQRAILIATEAIRDQLTNPPRANLAKPTIAELEAMLEERSPGDVIINPDGSISVQEKQYSADIAARVVDALEREGYLVQ